MDRQLLLFHRLAARRLRRHPELVEQARRQVPQIRPKWSDREVGAWRVLLSMPIDMLCHQLTARTEEMVWLRMASPFRLMPEFDLQDPSDRRRLWRLAIELSKRSRPVIFRPALRAVAS